MLWLLGLSKLLVEVNVASSGFLVQFVILPTGDFGFVPALE